VYWKAVIIGGIVFWIVTNIFGMFGTGILIHEKILDPIYRANESFWVPELRQDPPDMAALMPKWLINSLISSLIVSGIYVCVHSSFSGAGWKKGLMWGLCLGFFAGAMVWSWGGLFDLPAKMWVWLVIDGLILYPIGGAAMGWATARFAGT